MLSHIFSYSISHIFHLLSVKQPEYPMFLNFFVFSDFELKRGISDILYMINYQLDVLYPSTQLEKRKWNYASDIKGLHSSFKTILIWRMEGFYLLDFATDSFKYTP